jgi:hypothetical protein
MLSTKNRFSSKIPNLTNFVMLIKNNSVDQKLKRLIFSTVEKLREKFVQLFDKKFDNNAQHKIGNVALFSVCQTFALEEAVKNLGDKSRAQLHQLYSLTKIDPRAYLIEGPGPCKS